MARLLLVWEAGYRYRRLRVAERTRERIYEIQKENNFNNSEILIFLDVVNNKPFKEIRGYLLENGSKIVRRGKRTRPRKKKK
jgi:hypothetical protein